MKNSHGPQKDKLNWTEAEYVFLDDIKSLLYDIENIKYLSPI